MTWMNHKDVNLGPTDDHLVDEYRIESEIDVDSNWAVQSGQTYAAKILTRQNLQDHRSNNLVISVAQEILSRT